MAKNSKTEPHFSGLSGNLIRNSWFLYDLFSNVRIIFFTELSSNGSSWCKETNATISVQRGCFLFTNHYFFLVALTRHSYHSPFWIKCIIHTYSSIRMRAKGLHHVLLSIITLCVSYLALEVQLKVLKIHSFNKYLLSILYSIGIRDNSKGILYNIYFILLFFHTGQIIFRGLKELVQGQTLSQWQWPSIFSPHQGSANYGPHVKFNLEPIFARQEIGVQFLGWEDPLEEEMATHSSILA